MARLPEHICQEIPPPFGAPGTYAVTIVEVSTSSRFAGIFVAKSFRPLAMAGTVLVAFDHAGTKLIASV